MGVSCERTDLVLLAGVLFLSGDLEMPPLLPSRGDGVVASRRYEMRFSE